MSGATSRRVTSLALLAMCGAGFLSTSGAGAADGVAKPHQLIVNLRSRMYQVGETSGQFADLVAAERTGAASIICWVCACFARPSRIF